MAGDIYPDDTMLRLYGSLTSWYQLLSVPEEYADEAAFYRRLLTAESDAPVRRMLELGSGTGNNATHLKADFELTLVDLAPGMLDVSRALNPTCEHVQGDMRTVRLEREFDAVFIHDAIMYMLDEDDLRRAMETAFVHCRPGGVAVLAPDDVREGFIEATETGGNERDGRSLRYLQWQWDPDPDDTTFEVAFALILRERDGSVRVESDRHRCGLFSRDTWLRLLAEVGFEPRVVPDEWNRENFVARKPRR